MAALLREWPSWLMAGKDTTASEAGCPWAAFPDRDRDSVDGAIAARVCSAITMTYAAVLVLLLGLLLIRSGASRLQAGLVRA